MRKFWNWFSEPNVDHSCVRELRIDGAIAEESWLADEVTPRVFRDELNAGSGPIDLWLNSPGGDCVAASQIYTMLSEYPGEVTVKIDGVAASAASVIAMAGDKVLMAPTALLMIHNPLTCAFGNKEDMKQAIEMLDEFKESIINAYEKKTGLSRVRISRMMDNETWMNANRAIELGFCDGVIGNETVDSLSPEDSLSFSNVIVVNRLIQKMKAVDTREDLENESNRVAISSLYDRLHKLI